MKKILSITACILVISTAVIFCTHVTPQSSFGQVVGSAVDSSIADLKSAYNTASQFVSNSWDSMCSFIAGIF